MTTVSGTVWLRKSGLHRATNQLLPTCFPLRCNVQRRKAPAPCHPWAHKRHSTRHPDSSTRISSRPSCPSAPLLPASYPLQTTCQTPWSLPVQTNTSTCTPPPPPPAQKDTGTKSPHSPHGSAIHPQSSAHKAYRRPRGQRYGSYRRASMAPYEVEFGSIVSRWEIRN